MKSEPRRAAILLVIALLTSAVGAGAGGAAVTTEAELATIGVLSPGARPAVWIRGSMHLDGRWLVGSGAFVLTLDPGLLHNLNGHTEWTWGLTEAYLQFRRDPFDLRVGVERLVLETARLMLPFSVESADVLGTQLGRAGVRLIWYPNAATRIRAALLEDSDRFLPVLSVRHQFSSSEVEVHALAPAPGRTAFGIGASGLIRDLVVYGEWWTLTAPAESRYALGVSGTIGDGIWTLETGHAAAQATAVLPGGPPRRQVAGQLAYRLSEDLSVTGTARLFPDPDASRGQITLQIVRATGAREYSLSLTGLVGPEPFQGVITAAVSVSY